MTRTTKLLIAVLIAALAVVVPIAYYSSWKLNHALQDLQNQKAHEEILMKDAAALYRMNQKEIDTLRKSNKAHKDDRDSYVRASTARIGGLIQEKKVLIGQIARLKARTFTVPQLDSIHLALFGAPLNDSLHTIALDYSRKLTSDALMLPIEQRLRTNAETQLQEKSDRIVFMENNFKLQIHELEDYSESANGKIDSLHTIAKEMQGVITNQDRKYRWKRTKERIAEGAVLVGIILLVIL
jgi:hypothetical protein